MIIGIDYGLKHCGLSASDNGVIARPLSTTTVDKVLSELEKLDPELIVVGISEGKMKQRTLGFVKSIKKMLRLPVEVVDETLTSLEAEGTNKDKNRQHAVAAAVILQRYLDTKEDV